VEIAPLAILAMSDSQASRPALAERGTPVRLQLLRQRTLADHAGFRLIIEERTTGLEPATFGLGSQRSTN
jgi:hypothetical protein